MGIPWDFHSSGVLSPVILSEAQPECPLRGPLADRFGATRMSQRGRKRTFRPNARGVVCIALAPRIRGSKGITGPRRSNGCSSDWNHRNHSVAANDAIA